MKAELTINQIWHNCNILNFFFRTQARETLEEIHALIGCTMEGEEKLFDAIESNYENVEDLEDDLYNMSVVDFCEQNGIDCPQEEEEEEDDEEE